MNSKASKQVMVALPLMDAAISMLFVQQNPHIKHIKLSLNQIPTSGLAKVGINIFPTLLVWSYAQQKKKKKKNSSVFTIRKFWLYLSQVSPPNLSLLSSSMKLKETFQREKRLGGLR